MIDLTLAREAVEQARTSARAQGMPDANIKIGADVYLWLLDLAEEALMRRNASGDRAMTNPDPAAIARKLKPAQRKALLWLPADGSPVYGPIPRGARVACLGIKNLVDWRRATRGGRILSERISLTPLGLHVRAVLLAEAARDE